MDNGWKITAIVFICLFSALLAFNIWTVSFVLNEEAEVNNCYYNTCEGYPDALYEAGVCTCYSINENGEYEVGKTAYNK